MRPETEEIIFAAQAIIAKYWRQNLTLTVRQLYYRLIATDELPDSWIDPEYNARHGLEPGTKNTQKNYKRLASIISEGRMTGQIAWDAIEDRTRFLRRRREWDDARAFMSAAPQTLFLDAWKGQAVRPEIWIEKDALVGVLQPVAQEFGVPIMSTRGYLSQSEAWSTGQRLIEHRRNGQDCVILHFADHDPSGIDMSRDLRERLSLFSASDARVERLAFTIEQVRKLKPPPNPAKATDARFHGYKDRYGMDSWELDAVEPSALQGIAATRLLELMDEALFLEQRGRQSREREYLRVVSGLWPHLVEQIEEHNAEGDDDGP